MDVPSRAAQKGSATFFASLWTAITVAIGYSDAPLLFPIVFGLLDVILVWWALSLWLTEYRVTLDERTLTVVKRGFGAGKPVEIPRDRVQHIRAKRGMQAGSKLYYDLSIETADHRSYIAASALSDHGVATWLADRWLHGATERA